MRIRLSSAPLKSIKLVHPYLMHFLIMICTAVFILVYFISEEYYTSYTNLSSKLASESERIERAFSDVIKHTEFVMKVILMQIKQDPENLHHVENVINKYSVNPHLHNTLSWTVFCWVDAQGTRRVDSISGILENQPHHSQETYVSQAKNKPGKIHLGKDRFGTTSQKHILPTVIGAVDSNGKYIGSLTMGFDLDNLSVDLSKSLQDQDTSFALLDANFDIVSQFGNFEHKKYVINSKKLKNFIHDNHLEFGTLTHFSKINLMFEGDSIYIQRIPNYPFAIYLKYHNKNFIKSFHKEIFYRVIEVFIFTIVSLVIIFLIYKREKVLRDKAEHSKNIAIQALQSKNDFLAYTAHELRSPLSFIVSSSEMMMNKMFGPINRKYLEYISNTNQSGKELLVLIEDLLENMKLQKGHFTIHESLVDIKNLMIRSIKVNNINYNDKIIIETNFQKDLPSVHTDPKRLLQIFNNIISNAMKYSPENSVLKIDVRMHKEEIMIKFHDKGYGMSEEGLQKSMHEYEVAHDVNITNVKSIGLGLPLVKSLLELMELKFFIDSKLGSGTRITIVFPKHKVAQRS